MEILRLVLALSILFSFAEAVLVMGYNFLAGWSVGAFIPLIFLLPPAIVVLVMLFFQAKRIQTIPEKVFWGAVFFFLLPIIGNGLSIVLNSAGLPAIGKFVFTYRYWPLLLLPLSILIWSICAAVWIVRGDWEAPIWQFFGKVIGRVKEFWKNEGIKGGKQP